MSPPFWLQSLKGQGIRGFPEKTCRKDYNGNEPGRGENNSIPCEELLKEIRAHLSRKATKYRSSIILIWALISGDLMSRTMSGKRSPKNSDVGRNAGNSVSGDFSPKEIPSCYCSQVPVSTVLSAGPCEAFHRGLPVTRGTLTAADSWEVYSRILFKVQRMEQPSAQPPCPINLKGKAEPSFSRWKSLQGAEQRLHSARQIVTHQTNRYWDGKQVHLAQ